METIKSMQQEGLTKAPVYRPALETQLQLKLISMVPHWQRWLIKLR